MQANYWVRQMHCDPPNQNFGWAVAHPAAPHGDCEAEDFQARDSSDIG